MTIQFTAWPKDVAADYTQRGYWRNQSLTEIITEQLDHNGAKTAIICNGRHFTYNDIDRLSNQIAAEILLRDIPVGSTALVQLPNSAEFYIIYFALLKCGIATVNALFNHGFHELTAFAKQITPALLILSTEHPLLATENDQSTLLLKLADHCIDTDNTLLVNSPTLLNNSLLNDSLLHETVLNGKLPNNKLASMHWVNASTTLFFDSATVQQPVNQDTPADQVAFFQLSGGSTGTPKLIPRTHNDYFYSIRQSVVICELSTDCIYLCALPAPHNFTLSSPGALGVFYAGGTVVVGPDPSPASCFKLISQHQVTLTSLVPPALHLWLNEIVSDPNQHFLAHRSALSSLKVIQVGGAKLSATIAEKVETVLGCQLQQVFGMAEGLVNYTHSTDDQWHINNTQGTPMSPSDEIKILDESGIPVTKGEVGALWTRGPYTFRGYYNATAANSRAFDDDGFYCTGDLVKQTDSDYLIVMGRNKDQINRGGEKIDAQEVEELILQLPSVTDVALVAIPDHVLGERSGAYIIKNTDINARELRRYLREQGIASYKIPDHITFVEGLPKTAVGKIDKRALRELTHQELTY